VLAQGLADLRTARNLSPLYPETHLLLGLHAKGFASAEPPLAHFERAKLLNKVDPNIWYVCGLAHRDAGNLAGAAENWRQSLELSTQQLPAILAAAQGRFPPAEVAARILPDNPVTLVQAAEYFRGDPPIRTAILERAAAAAEQPAWEWRPRVAVAEAADLLGRTAEADALWTKAVAADPNVFDVRFGYSQFLEREERYEDALPHLEWLSRVRPADPSLRDRILYCRHGAALNEKLRK
jgi:tetratricopeptide (TPR) repeat protein